jgi:hypothetical protein
MVNGHDKNGDGKTAADPLVNVELDDVTVGAAGRDHRKSLGGECDRSREPVRRRDTRCTAKSIARAEEEKGKKKPRNGKD